MNKRNITIILTFVLLLSSLSIASLLMEDQNVSTSERRTLTQFVSYIEMKDKKGNDYSITDYFSYLEDYMLDQFPLRDAFRTIKAECKRFVLNQQDNNGYYLVDGYESKMDDTLRVKAVEYNVTKLNKIVDTYFENSNVYYSIIPDKNYFLASQNQYPSYDYDTLFAMVKEMLPYTYIDVASRLDITDYYKTDTHWDQSKIVDVADHLLQTMGNTVLNKDLQWDVHTIEHFAGTYYGQAAFLTDKDVLTYLTSKEYQDITVYDVAREQTIMLANESYFSHTDPYDVFLAGATPLITINNPHGNQEKQLVVFRDSFGSSLSPLLLSDYGEVVIVDIRYIQPSTLSDYVKWKDNNDVLLIYSTSVLNTPGIF